MAWRAISGSGDPTQINPLDPLYFASHLDGMMTVLSHSIEGGVGTLTRRAVSVNRAEVILGDAAAEVTDMVDYIALSASDRVIVAVAVNAVGAIRFDPPLRSTQQRLTQERHHGRAVQILMRASGGARREFW